jgi:hypothetical protein
MRKIVNKTSFLGGEAGPLLEGRSDLPQFQLGISPGKNMIALKSGPLTRRPGTRYVKNTVSDSPARILDWVISYDDGDDIYVVELSQSAPTTIDVRVIRVGDLSVYTPTNSPITVGSTFNLNEVQYAQIGSSLFLVHKSFEPKVLTRTATSPTFSIDNYIALASVSSRPVWFSLPYKDPNVSALTLTINTATVGTGRTVTSSSPFFSANHVGAYFRSKVTATNGWFKVTGFTNSTTVTVEVLSALDGTTATSNGIVPVSSTTENVTISFPSFKKLSNVCMCFIVLFCIFF